MGRWTNPLAFLAIILGVGAFGLYSLHDPAPRRMADGLSDARGPDVPSRPCGGRAPADAFILTLGNSALWFHDFPHTVVTLNGAPVLVLDRNPDGTIAVDLALYLEGRQVGRLQGVTLHDDQGLLRLARPTGSELIISTPDGTPVVQIDYPARRSLRITGHLTFGEHDLTLPVGGFMQDGKAVNDTCLGGGHKVDFAL